MDNTANTMTFLSDYSPSDAVQRISIRCRNNFGRGLDYLKTDPYSGPYEINFSGQANRQDESARSTHGANDFIDLRFIEATTLPNALAAMAVEDMDPISVSYITGHFYDFSRTRWPRTDDNFSGWLSDSISSIAMQWQNDLQWKTANRRRAYLIEKEILGLLSMGEQIELDQLQKDADDQLSPLLPKFDPNGYGD